MTAENWHPQQEHTNTPAPDWRLLYWGPQTHGAHQGPWEDCSPSPCPEQAQPWGQTKLLRAFYTVGSGNIPRMEMAQPVWAPAALLGWLHGEKPFPYRQAEHILFQSVTIVSHPPAVCCPEEQLSLLSNLLIDYWWAGGHSKNGASPWWAQTGCPQHRQCPQQCQVGDSDQSYLQPQTRWGNRTVLGSTKGLQPQTAGSRAGCTVV